MAVPVQTPYQEYTANGVATSFAVAFQCLSKDTLIVTINGVEQSSALWNFTGGNVVFIAAPANLSIIAIKRSTAFSREITYQTHDNSFRPDVLNGDIDRLWHALQESQFIYNKKVDKAAQIQTLGNLQGGGEIQSGLTLSLKDQTVTANYQFGSSIKIPVITLNQDGTVKSLHEVDVIGGAGGAFQINWTDVLNKPTTLGGYGITNAYTKTEANAAFIEEEARGNAFGVAELNGSGLLYPSNLPQATETAIGAARIATTAIAQAGTNDSDIITPLKLSTVLGSVTKDIENITSSLIVGTTYTNTLPHTIFIGIYGFYSNQSGKNSFFVGSEEVWVTDYVVSAYEHFYSLVPIGSGKTYRQASKVGVQKIMRYY